jgi:photosystem II stability/assembly factor-like uncharacterized protein
MHLARPFRRAFCAAAPLLVSAACAEPAGPTDAHTRPGGASYAAASGQPLAHWMRIVALPAAYDMALAPGGVLYAASADAGVFRSADRARWEHLPGVAPEADATTIAVAPDGAVYVGTAAGVLRSHDGGTSWVPAGLEDQHVSHVAVDARGSVLAAASGVFGGLFRSDDGGLHWTRILDPVGGRESFFTFLRVRRGDVVLGFYAQVPWLGYDGGAAWSPLLSLFELPDFVGSVDDLLETSNGSLVAAWANGIARSNDGGVSWKPVFEGTPTFKLLEDAETGALYALVSPGPRDTLHRRRRDLDALRRRPPMTGIDAFALAPDGRLIVGGYDWVWRSTR